MLRVDIITAYGLDGGPSLPQDEGKAIHAVEILAKAKDLAVTITPAVGVCDPWPTENVLVVTCYVNGARLGDVKALADDIRITFAQDAVSFATTESNFTLLEGKS